MREVRGEGAVRTTEGEGVDRVVAAAPRDLTVREAILAAAEHNSGVPEQRQAAAPRSAAAETGPLPPATPDREPGQRRRAAADTGAAERRRHG
jgi:hypothetical protein